MMATKRLTAAQAWEVLTQEYKEWLEVHKDCNRNDGNCSFPSDVCDTVTALLEEQAAAKEAE